MPDRSQSCTNGVVDVAVDTVTTSPPALPQQGTGRDEAAILTALMEQYGRRIFAFIYRMMDGNADDAADLTQETFLRAYRALGRTPDDLHAGAWLHRIARNCCYDALRRRHIRWRPWDIAVEDRASGGIDETNPEHIVLCREADDAVRAVLGRMSPRGRRALVLRVSDGLSCGEVAATMGVTDGAARALLVRARGEFRRLSKME